MWQYFSAARFGWAVGIVLISLIVRFATKLHIQRTKMKGLPGPPHSYIWGHLRAMDVVLRKQPKNAAPQTGKYQGELVRELRACANSAAFASFVKEEYGLGDYFYVDVWPAGDPILMIFDTDIMHEITVKNSLPKHPEVEKFLLNFGGPGNLVSSEGAEWKKWRSAFNPGFSATHLMSLVPILVDECSIFVDTLTKHAKNNDLFRMERDATQLTVDIIGRVVLDHKLNSQRAPNKLVDAFMMQVRWQEIGIQFNPIELIDWPVRYVIHKYLNWTMDRYIGTQIDERFATRDRRGKSKAIIDLALEAYMKEVKGTSSGDTSKAAAIDPEFRKAAINNMKTFIFAGHDTTSSTISYAYYYLSKNPATLARIRKEHDDVFGTDLSTVSEQIRQSAHLINKLEYTLAVTREVLRLQPPASTIRIGQKGFFIHDPVTGEALPTEGFMLWSVDVGLHRSEKYWQDPHVFRPERHLHGGKEEDGSANFTSNAAWVAFSKGPRNCIGQELAIIETKVILAMTLRAFDFASAYDELDKLQGDKSGYPSDATGIQEQFGDEAYQIQLGTAKPREGMPMRVKVRSP
ncbi:hypothetical protein LTR10_007901 [Elasticomyces elasticus]|uniref:Cytochrome P450 n=1 Tax=Elasticomyces elasticus TaxID=574655 RepID=A0AAN7WE08_9PEZI|nr:hypothetical protein LTR10_007901 [Elasticomyces elasticus]KAK4970901.1 hypothetical protein LTR42_007878 [Elasticomyces elasticus]KAK5696752.1 hypothetical protein LTR97_008056 [Elasticomyces elasticus]